MTSPLELPPCWLGVMASFSWSLGPRLPLVSSPGAYSQPWSCLVPLWFRAHVFAAASTQCILSARWLCGLFALSLNCGFIGKPSSGLSALGGNEHTDPEWLEIAVFFSEVLLIHNNWIRILRDRKFPWTDYIILEWVLVPSFRYSVKNLIW